MKVSSINDKNFGECEITKKIIKVYEEKVKPEKSRKSLKQHSY